MTADSPPGGPWGRPAAPAPRVDTQGGVDARGRFTGRLGSSLAGRLRAGGAGGGVPLTTPLVWAWGGVLLTASTWLVGVIAVLRSVGGLFD